MHIYEPDNRNNLQLRETSSLNMWEGDPCQAWHSYEDVILGFACFLTQVQIYLGDRIKRTRGRQGDTKEPSAPTCFIGEHLTSAKQPDVPHLKVKTKSILMSIFLLNPNKP